MNLVMRIGGPLAERFQAGERLALRHWIRLDVGLTGMEPLKMRINKGDMTWLSGLVKKHGGDPEKLREKGRGHIMRMMEKEHGGMQDA